jgi:hypothetical protein
MILKGFSSPLTESLNNPQTTGPTRDDETGTKNG